MNKFIAGILLLFSTLHSFAQVDIRNEIIAFTDSTELIIRNGRKLIIDKIVTGDHQAAISTLNFLKKTVDDKYIILYPSEEILVSLATRNFELFLFNAENFKTLLEGKTKYIRMEPISEELNQYLSMEMNFVSDELLNSKLPAADIEFIQLYIRYYMNEDKTELYQSVKNYQKKNPENKYNDFLNEMKQLTTTGRMSFCFGYGQEFLNSEMADAFSNRLHCMYIEMDGFINRLYLSLFVGGSVGKHVSNYDMPIKKTDLVHEAGERVNSVKYGIKIGHSVFNNHSVNFYPYFSIGGYKMMSASPVVDTDASVIKNILTHSFYSGIGASCDVALKKWKSKNPYEPEGMMFARPGIGYDHFLTSQPFSKGGDFYFSFTLGVSLGGM
jgi:hypothetical protein